MMCIRYGDPHRCDGKARPGEPYCEKCAARFAADQRANPASPDALYQPCPGWKEAAGRCTHIILRTACLCHDCERARLNAMTGGETCAREFTKPPLGRRRPWAQANGCRELIVDGNGKPIVLMPTADLAAIVVASVNFRNPQGGPYMPSERGPWRQASDDPGRIEDAHHHPIGWMWRPELAAMVVAAANAWNPAGHGTNEPGRGGPG